jgi:hypothetical protein
MKGGLLLQPTGQESPPCVVLVFLQASWTAQQGLQLVGSKLREGIFGGCVMWQESLLEVETCSLRQSDGLGECVFCDTLALLRLRCRLSKYCTLMS